MPWPGTRGARLPTCCDVSSARSREFQNRIADPCTEGSVKYAQA